jgi:hypothetical protein
MQVSVEEMLRSEAPKETNNTNYFSLKKDGDSAIVRFLHKDINDFDVLDVHNVDVGGYKRKVNCLRRPNGKVDECQFCRNNTFDEENRTYKFSLQRRFFVHLLEYETPQKATEKVWERSKDLIKTLNQYVEDYGPLCDRLYKIVRHGETGSTETKYDILALDKDRFNPSEYVFNKEQLNYKPALGTAVLDKTNEEIDGYLVTGNFNYSKSTSIPKVEERPEYVAPEGDEVRRRD